MTKKTLLVYGQTPKLLLMYEFEASKNRQLQNDCNQMSWWWHGLEEFGDCVDAELLGWKAGTRKKQEKN